MPDLSAPAHPRPAWHVLTGLFIAVPLTVAMAPGASAQITADRTYYGINRPVPMSVTVPPGAGPGGVFIALLEPVTAKPIARVQVQAGGVDMAALFPSLWTGTPRLVYAQLMVGESMIGPAVVLQPMVTPAHAGRIDAYGDPDFKADAGAEQRVYTGMRAYTDQFVVLETTKGQITISLRPDAAPNTVWNFRELVAGGFYTDVLVHRVVPLDSRGHPVLIQTGDPLGTGAGGPGYQIDLEPSPLPHDFGVVSMARLQRDPNSAGSQFFICLSREGTAAFDHGYASFGQCIAGAEVIQAIAAVPIAPPSTTGRERPLEPPVIRSARLVDAPPYGEYPAPVAAPGSGPIRK